METYIDKIVKRVSEKTGLKGKEICKLYALLVLVKGEEVTLSDVHDAWSVQMNYKEINPPYCYGHEHKSIVPFDDLPYETQLRDQPYVEALREIARELSATE